MKSIHNEYVKKRIMKRVYRIIFSILTAFALILTLPIGYQKVSAAPLEDCDLDGYDDATGVPVPWPGYDETKGDTPDGPGGSNSSSGGSNASAGNVTTDGTGANTGGIATGSAGNASDSNIDSNSSGSTGSIITGNNKADDSSGSATSGSINNTTIGNTGSTAGNSDTPIAANNGTTAAYGIGSTKAGNTDNPSGGEQSSIAEDNTSDTSNTGDNKASVDGNDSIVTDTANILSGNSDSTEAGNPDNGTVNGTVLAEDANNGIKEVSPSAGSQGEGDSDITPFVTDTASAVESEAAVNPKGLLEITEADGSVLHAGSQVNIIGTGFGESTGELEIVLPEASWQLGSVIPDENGAFVTEVRIPEELEAGVYQIAVNYDGTEIARQQIEVGPKVADSFVQALSVGFSRENKGLIPGLTILGGLLALGSIVLAVNETLGAKRREGIAKT